MGEIMTKQEARELMKKKRKDMDSGERRRQDQEIAKKLLGLDCWQKVSWFFPFVSYGTEVDTISVLRHALEFPVGGKKLHVAVPRVRGQEMDFFEITSMEELEPGNYGILEPKQFCPRVEAEEGVMLLPGLAFDWNRSRVGYGGGYYDRYLGRYGNEKLLTVAVAYDFQVVDMIEVEEHDRRPQEIITASYYIQ